MKRLFGTDGIRGKVNEYPFTEDMVYRIGRSVAFYIKKLNAYKRKTHRISIAKDTRNSGHMLEQNLIKGITSAGVDVVTLGIMPTACSSFLVRELKDDLGIVISASHNDIEDNGFKFFNHKGHKFTIKHVKEIEEMIIGCKPSENKDDGARQQGKAKEDQEAILLYIDFLKKILGGLDISKYSIAADCAYGSVSRLMPKLKRHLGLDIRTINDNPSGDNINSACGSLYPGVVSDYVIKEGCDCGFAFDGDGDRVIACDETGAVLDGDYILAIIGKYLDERGKLSKKSIVTTHMSNIGLEMSISQWGGRLVKTEVGDKYVLDKMLKGKYNLGGEQSGHIILIDHSKTGDGLLTAFFLLKVMAEEQKSLKELSRSMYKFPQILLNVEVKEKMPIKELPKLTRCIEKSEKKLGSKGRIYIRYSGTENKLRIMIEGQNQAQIKELADDIASVAKEELDAKARC
jgi:phosphoglucosamine mutase